MSNQDNRVFSYYNSRFGLGPQYFVDYLRGDLDPQKKIILYYRLTVSPTDASDNATRTNFDTTPIINTYRGISNRYMTESDYTTYNKNILTFVGYRTPANNTIPYPATSVPPIYNETININIEPYDSNYIQATANYLDLGSGFATTISFVDYKVTTASGVFRGFTNVRVEFFNGTNITESVRKVTIT